MTKKLQFFWSVWFLHKRAFLKFFNVGYTIHWFSDTYCISRPIFLNLLQYTARIITIMHKLINFTHLALYTSEKHITSNISMMIAETQKYFCIAIALWAHPTKLTIHLPKKGFVWCCHVWYIGQLIILLLTEMLN